MQGVARLMPQVEVVNIGGDDLIVSALPVVFLDEFNEFIVDACTVRKPECGSRGEVVEHDETLFLGDATVIAFLGLL